MKDFTPIPTTGIQNKWTVEECRTIEYKKWRIQQHIGPCQDIDQLEYKIVDGKVIPLAIFELSKVEGRIISEPAYLNTVLKHRNVQMKTVESIARNLGIPAFYILFEDHFERMWQLDLLNRSEGWKQITINEHERFIKSLHTTKLEEE